MNKYLNLYAVFVCSSSSQRSRSFHSSRSLEGSLIRKPDFDRIHPFHVFGPAYRRYELANNVLSNIQKELTPICELPPKVFPSIRHNDHRQNQFQLLQTRLPLSLSI
jgi:hypothetical protein